jgi:hypothetical protein
MKVYATHGNRKRFIMAGMNDCISDHMELEAVLGRTDVIKES